MNSILITGCNRGIGLGLVRCLTEENLGNYPKHIFATCRNVEKAQVNLFISLIQIPAFSVVFSLLTYHLLEPFC